MKNRLKGLVVAASAVTCSFVSAQTADGIAAASRLGGGYIGVSGVHNEYTASLLGEEGDDYAEGLRFNAGMLLGSGFSADGSFESVSGSAQGDDFRLSDTRLLFNYSAEAANGLSLGAGVGYGFINANIENLLGVGTESDIETDGFLLKAGVKYEVSSFTGFLNYTHLVAQSAKMLPADLDEEDIGLLEVGVGVKVTERLVGTIAIETQVVGDTMIEKDWGLALGVQYKF